MGQTDSPHKLKKFCKSLEENGGIGLLISGGCNSKGKVPLEEFYDTLRWIKEKTGLIVNLHTGLLDLKSAENIASTGIDIVSLDIVGSNETIRRVYHIQATLDDYKTTLNNLINSQVQNIVPHICIGLDYGELKGELNALELLKTYNPETLVFLVLMPTPGTLMEEITPPNAHDVAKIISKARMMFPDTILNLGCMRPRFDKEKMERLAIEAGIDGIVLPSSKTIKLVKDIGYRAKHLDGCCALPKNLEHLGFRT